MWLKVVFTENQELGEALGTHRVEHTLRKRVSMRYPHRRPDMEKQIVLPDNLYACFSARTEERGDPTP